MNVLVIDVGGTHVKILASGEKEKREFDSGPTLTARQMVSSVRKLADGWEYDVVSIGYPGPVAHDRPLAEPYNLGKGWAGFNFDAEEVGGFALVEDEEDLCEKAVALNGFEDDYLIDLRLKSGAFGVGHDFTGWRSGARKLTVLRRTTSLRWL